MPTIRRASYRRSFVLSSSYLLLAGLAAWLALHIYKVIHPGHSSASLALVWLLSFVAIAWTNLLAMLERPKRPSASAEARLDRLKICVLIPAYNEDEPLLQACIEALLRQTRLPDYIEVVDDGSTQDYAATKAWLKSIGGHPTIHLLWTRTSNGGKRHAQAVGMKHRPDADIYLTVDSDTVLDPDAIRQGLLPFADKTIQSVAGVCLPLNVTDNLLTRFTGLWETVWQLVDRSSQSRMNCVTVNSGVLAFYRGDVVRRYLSAYLSETFMTRPVKFSDDSLLTLYAMQHGKTVQQTTSIAFSAVPNKTSHHIRRYMRWMRGSFIRTWWRFKYLPINSYIYWLHLFRWMQFVLSTVIFIYLMLQGTLLRPELLPYLIGVPVLLGYAQSLRYFMIARNDEPLYQQCITYATAPIAVFWQLTVLRIVKWYSYCTVFNMAWGTRQKIEVGLQP